MARAQIQLNDELYDYMMAVSDREPPLLARLREETQKLERGFWQIPSNQGQFMALLVQVLAPKMILEVGTFTGYSALSMAMAMPEDGRILACDISEEYTNIARRYWREAGVDDKIELRLGDGRALLDGLLAEDMAGSFDLCFIDADKENYPAYYEKSLQLVKKGGLIIVDNTLFDGRVVGQNLEGLADWQLKWTEDLKVFNASLKDDDRIDLSLIPVGDGMTFCRVR